MMERLWTWATLFIIAVQLVASGALNEVADDV